MIYILFISLVLITINAYVICKQNILSPWVILCSVFSVSTFFAMLNVRKWNYDLKVETVLVIIVALLFFGAGEIIISIMFEKLKIFNDYKHNKNYNTNANKIINISFLKIALLSLIMMFMLIYYFYKTYQLSISAGNTNGISSMLKYARLAQLNSENIGRLGGYISFFVEAVALLFGYIFLSNIILFKFRIKFLYYLLPVILYIPFIVLSTGRTEFINYIAAFIVIGCIFYQIKNGWDPRNSIRILMIASFSLVLFYIIFIAAGYLTGKSQVYKAFDLISFYTGVSIPCFNQYLINPKPDTRIIGEHTLYSVFSLLNSIGFDDMPDSLRHLEFLRFGGIKGNVYTALRRYIQDYSIYGMLLLQLFFGMFFSFFINLIKKRNKQGFIIIIYSFIFYSLVMMSIDDLFLSSIISLGTFYELIMLAVLYYYFIIHQKLNKEILNYEVSN